MGCDSAPEGQAPHRGLEAMTYIRVPVTYQALYCKGRRDRRILSREENQLSAVSGS